MTIKQIQQERTKQHKLLQDKQHAHDEFTQANYRIMEDLDLQEKIAHDELVKRIKRHFKGIKLHIGVSRRGILISYNDIGWLTYKYGETTYEGITKKLCNIIIAEYEEVYGDVEECKQYVEYTTCGDNMFGTCDTLVDVVNSTYGVKSPFVKKTIR